MYAATGIKDICAGFAACAWEAEWLAGRRAGDAGRVRAATTMLTADEQRFTRLAEVLATAWRRVADLPADDEEAAAWLFGIARGTLANYRRGQTRRHALADRLRAHLEHRLREAAHRPMRLSPFATPSPSCPPTTGSCSHPATPRRCWYAPTAWMC
jgi:hypothetical protein